MAQPLLLLSNGIKASGTGGITIRKFYPSAQITSGSTSTGVPFYVVPVECSNGVLITNAYVSTGGVAPSSGTITIDVKKNANTSIFATAPTVTTTAATGSSVNVNSSTTTGYVIPVLSATAATLNLAAGDQLAVTVTGGATATDQLVTIEIQDMSGNP